MFRQYTHSLAAASLLLLAATLDATEYQYAKGTLDMQGGFIGLDSTISADISTHTVTEKHKNIFSTTWYYRYDITWYDSQKMVNAQQSFNAASGSIFGNPYNPTGFIPAIAYRFQGLDANIALGKDVYHKNKRTFLGIGITLGVSLPWIESQKDSSNNDNTTDTIMKAMKKSKTKMLTYKIGPSINAGYAFNKYFMTYLNATYAFQAGTMKNDYIDTKLDLQGTFEAFDVGIKMQPFAEDLKTKYITLSPRLYASVGWRYIAWKLEDVAFDITGASLPLPKSDFESSSGLWYFGIGYDFF